MKVHRSKKKNQKMRGATASITVLLICCAAACGTVGIVKGHVSMAPLSQGGSGPFAQMDGLTSSPQTEISGRPRLYPNQTRHVGAVSQPAAETAAKAKAADFSDAVFIGDSRTQALQTYGVLKGATYYAARGLMVNTAFTKNVIPDGKGGQLTVVEALKGKQFERVYIMLGVNELGWSSSQAFTGKYGELIDAVKASQPSADIYIQSILPVSSEKSAGDKIYNNKRIAEYNQMLQKLAQEKDVNYTAVDQAVMDKSGALPADASSDGVHPNKEYCKKWAAYLEQENA